jgi:hypothetical protein
LKRLHGVLPPVVIGHEGRIKSDRKRQNIHIDIGQPW